MLTELESQQQVVDFFGYLAEKGFVFEFARRGWDNFDSLHAPLDELSEIVQASTGKEQKVCEARWVVRFSPSGRLVEFDNDVEAYHFLLGALTSTSEREGRVPFVASHDGMLDLGDITDVTR